MATSPTFEIGSIGQQLSQWCSVRESMTEDAARLVVAGAIKPCPICPGCKVSLDDQERQRLYAGRSIVCRHCGKKHRLTTGTVLEGIHADFRDVVMICVMHRHGTPLVIMEAVTGLSDDTIRRMIKHRLGVL